MLAKSGREPERISIALGPVAEGWGSWEWVGADLYKELARDHDASEFQAWEIPQADLVIAIKHAPPSGWAEQVARRCALIYAPVDRYGSAGEIDADIALFRHCRHVVIHCERLRRYIEPYVPVTYMDHHIKYASPMKDEFVDEGEILWVGVRTNLPPLVDWVNAHPLPRPLRILTNPEDAAKVPSAEDVGFRPRNKIAIERWTPQRHIEVSERARAFLDIKGDDFRSRHKPPAKGIDAIASGLPLAMNRDSSTTEHLARMGFEICSPENLEHWFSREYWEQTHRVGGELRVRLDLGQVSQCYRTLIREMIGT